MATIKWEKIEEVDPHVSNATYIERAKVPGGWLIRTHVYEGGGLTFLPDPNHTWT